MWREIRREAARFRSGVVAGVGRDGTPVSARCGSRIDEGRGVLVIDDPYPVEAGKASLLYHRHDERLWKLRSCLIIGVLSRHGDEWLFQPERFVPGMGIGGPVSYVRLLVRGRTTASRYLRDRGLDRPPVAWQDIYELLEKAAGVPSSLDQHPVQ